MRRARRVAGLLESGQAAALAADPAGLVRDAVEEGLRWVSPIGTQTRRASSTPSSAASRCPRARTSACSSRRPTATRRSGGRRPPPTTSSGRSATTPRSASGRISAPVTTSRACRCGSRSSGCSSGSRPASRPGPATRVQRLGVPGTAASARPAGTRDAVDLGPADLADGELREADGGRSALGLARVGGRYVAFETLVHARRSARSRDGWLEGEAIRCACHGSLFALGDGRAARGPRASRSDPVSPRSVTAGRSPRSASIPILPA